MMNNDPSKNSLKYVEAWESAEVFSLSEREQAILFAKAIQAIKAKSLTTLSLVTVLVIADRVLCECKIKYNFLEKVKVAPEGIDFTDILEDPQILDSEKILAFRSLLICFLDVLGRLTAEILTPKLHAELKSINSRKMLFKLNQISSGPLSSRARNREQK